MAEIEEKMVDSSTTDDLEDAYADAMPEEVPSAEDGGHLVPGDEGEHDAELHEQILTQETMWSGKIFDVERMEVKLPNGRCSVRDVVRHCGAVAIVALTENGKIALVRQYRTALDRVTVEIPAGKMDPGEEQGPGPPGVALIRNPYYNYHIKTRGGGRNDPADTDKIKRRFVRWIALFYADSRIAPDFIRSGFAYPQIRGKRAQHERFDVYPASAGP